MKLSICIPTFNRAAHLANCLESIVAAQSRSAASVEVCVSDNASTDETESVVRRTQGRIPIKYHRNARNLGIPANFLNVVSMATGDFAWLVGDDDLLLPSALEAIHELMARHPAVDFFYVNSYHLAAEYVLSFPQPFDTANLPEEMVPFSPRAHSSEMRFFDLVNPAVSFDFLGGMFLSVFRRERWMAHVNALDPAAVADSRSFSHFDNTFPHVKIFARAFGESRAFFQATPVSVCLAGAREWAPLYPLVRSVRLVEALEEYRSQGMPWRQYVRCRSYALRHFFPDLVRMFLHPRRSGLGYVKPLKLLARNCWYPGFYQSLFGLFGALARRVMAAVRLQPEASPFHPVEHPQGQRTTP